ncbi:MAG: phytanoyl-CoA dioxygenase family protein [Gammaproteobacteria bacterium]|nr:phytanoyl-CoA dioxygenase family protein [Gammaproteobacteria bacterium]
MSLNPAQLQQFKIDGYLVLSDLLADQQIQQLRALTETHLKQRREPLELESEVNYPGAPVSREAEGGATIRRLRSAYQRDPLYRDLAQHPLVAEAIRQILTCEQLLLNPSHHNCIMTKQPAYSSATLWHRDTRYWHFDNKYLINAWFALGNELPDNGAMQILPGSHRWEIQEDALDEAQFLKPDHPFNQDRMATARTVALQAGDVVLFSAHCFHAAGKNMTDRSKYSVVFTYHGATTKPLPGTPSASQPEIPVVTPG